MVELARPRMRTAVGRRIIFGRQWARLDELNGQENARVERLREWYGLHFPELARWWTWNVCSTCATHGQRDRMPISQTDSVGAPLGSRRNRSESLAGLAKLVGGGGPRSRATSEKSIRDSAPNVSQLVSR